MSQRLLHFVCSFATAFAQAVLLAAIFLGSASGLPLTVLPETSEASSPLEDGDEELDAAVRGQRRVNLKADRLAGHSCRPQDEARRQRRNRPISHPLKGHRLSNGLLAPLIC